MSDNEIYLLHVGKALSPLIQLVDALPAVQSGVCYSIGHAGDADELIHSLAERLPDSILLDLTPASGFDLGALGTLTTSAPDIPVLVVVADGDMAGAANQHGAADVLTMDDTLSVTHLDRAVRHLVERSRLSTALRESEARYQRIAANTADDITRLMRAEQEIRDSERFARTTLDALADHIAILDGDGNIVAVNHAWLRAEPYMCWIASVREGAPYLQFCERPDSDEPKYGQAIAEGIRAVMNHEVDHFSLEYPCMRDDHEMWFVVTVTPYPEDERFSAVVSHADITDRKSAETAQRTSEHRFHNAINNLPDAFTIYDAERRVRFVNARALEMSDFREEDVFGKRGEDLHPPEVAGKYLPLLERAFATGRRQREEVTFESPTGGKTFVISFVPQLDASGAIYEVLSLSQDITEHKQAEQFAHEQRTLAEALRDTSAMLTSTLDLRTVMVRILENVGRVVSHDAANIMLIEGSVARVAYRHGYDERYDDFFADYRFPLSLPHLNRMFTTGGPMLASMVDSDPDWVFLPLPESPRSSIGVPIRSHNQVIGFLNLDSQTSGFFNEGHADRLRAFADYAAIAIENAQLYETMRHYAADLEQRVEERTQELQRAKDQVEAILNSRSDAVILTFLTGVIRQANPAFCDLFGYAADEVVSMSIEALADDSTPALLMALNDVIATNQPRRLECVMRRRDGTSFDADTMLSRVQDGNQPGIVCSMRDISARKQMEGDLRRAFEKERELGELKTRFVSMASHEFRTPLSTIMTSSDLLRHYSHRMTEERRSEHLDTIQDNIRHLTRLIDDVLVIGRADAKRLDVHPVPLEIVRFAADLASEMQANNSANGSVIYFSAASDVIEATVDRDLVRQIIANLLSNAVKYSPSGTPVFFTAAQDGASLVLTIQDSGIGIPPRDQEHLFEAFHRGANVEAIEGSGLGLAIIQRAVKVHGGTIDFESTVGVGTTFVVRIPLAPATAGEPVALE